MPESSAAGDADEAFCSTGAWRSRRSHRDRCGGRVALRAIVKKQIEAGVDVIDDGEQSRESFVLYVRHRLTGLGGTGTRLMHADLDNYPKYKADFQSRTVGKETVSNRAQLPKAIGEVTYVDRARSRPNAPISARRSTEAGSGFVEPFLTAPSPGIIAASDEERVLRHASIISPRSARRCRSSTRRSSAHGFLLQLDCPDLALERHTSYQRPAARRFLGFVERVVATINKALATSRATGCGCMSAGAITRGRTTATCRSATSCPILKANVGGFVLPFANPRHEHEYRVFRIDAAGRRPNHRRRRHRHA